MWQNYHPRVNKIWLYLIAGIMWSGVGLMLLSLSARWLVDLHSGWATAIGLFGLLLALAAYRFGFSKIARKNILRLHGLLDRVWLFAFMPWKSYLVVVGMMALGMALRHSLIPRSYLAVIYATIGGALFLSSLEYYQVIYALITSKE